MAGSSFVLIVFLSLTLYACIAGARKIPMDDRDVQPNTKDFDSVHRSFFVIHGGREQAESKENVGANVKEFDSEHENFFVIHGGSGEGAESKENNDAKIKDFDSGHENFFVIHGGSGKGVESKKNDGASIKDFDSGHENFFVIHGGSGGGVESKEGYGVKSLTKKELVSKQGNFVFVTADGEKGAEPDDGGKPVIKDFVPKHLHFFVKNDRKGEEGARHHHR